MAQTIVNSGYKTKGKNHKIILTKEHGSWAVLFVPIITGVAVSENLTWPVILLIISLIFLFMSYSPAEIILQSYLKKQPLNGKLANARYWFSVFFSAAFCTGVVSLVLTSAYILLLFALAAIVLFMLSFLIEAKVRKNVFSDFLAMTGLTLSAPAIVYFLDNSFASKSIYLWFFNVLFFGSSAAYVHMKIKISALKKKKFSLKEKLLSARLNLTYQVITFLLVLIYTKENSSEYVVIAGFMPAILHAVLGSFIYPEKVSFKKIGITYVAYSIVFALSVVLALR